MQTSPLDKSLFEGVWSCGLRICLIAEGTRNIYISTGNRGNLWDYCQGDIILSEAGGFISDMKGNPIDYRSDNGELKHGAVVCTYPELYKNAIKALN